jgi:hypothetical protein
MSRSAYPTGGARTPRLRMATKEAIALYRRERASSQARNADALSVERTALEAAMARSAMQQGKVRIGNCLTDARRGKAANELNDCMCGCGLKCQGRRRTATDDCLVRLKTANNKAYRARVQAICDACQRPFTRGKMPSQRYCKRPACQREVQYQKARQRYANKKAAGSLRQTEAAA